MPNVEKYVAVLSVESNEANIKKTAQGVRGIDDRLKDMKKNMGMLSKVSQALTMNFLGIMFFGMMLQKTFLGLLRPAMEVFGIFDLWNILLMTTFLPIMEELFPYFLAMVEFFLNLDEGTKKAIGAFVVFMVILGTILMVFGQLALGIGSLIQIFDFMGISLGGLVGVVSGTFLAILAIVLYVLAGIYLAWQENFLGIRTFMSIFIESIKAYWFGLYNVIAGIIKLVVAIFTGDFQKGTDSVKQIFKGLGGWFIGFWGMFFSLMNIIKIGVIRMFWGIVTFIKNAFKAMFEYIDGLGIEWVNKMIDIIQKVVNALNRVISKLKSISGIGFSKLGNVGLSVLGKFTTGLGGGSSSKTNNNNIEIINNVNVSDKAEMERAMDENNRKLTDDLLRQISPTQS